ncbi:MAG TPA: hypothetical protein VLA36_05435 [Longimicrobiales bacterium]|nr:hypothetical protein [Longimicrobiales bacterium]
MASVFTLTPVRAAFRAVTRAAVPSANEFDEAAWLRGEALVETALSDRPARVRRQVVLFLRILAVLSWFRFGRSVGRLTSPQAQRLLAPLERSPLLALRRGVWGVRTLAFMGCYGQEELRRAIGYAAAPRGWEALGSNQGAWPDRGGDAPPESGVLTAPPEGDRHG